MVAPTEQIIGEGHLGKVPPEDGEEDGGVEGRRGVHGPLQVAPRLVQGPHRLHGRPKDLLLLKVLCTGPYVVPVPEDVLDCCVEVGEKKKFKKWSLVG